MSDYATEAEALEEFDQDHAEPVKRHRRRGFRKRVDNTDRYRCLIVGCNPVLHGEQQADAHRESTGHRTARWPVRSAAGEAKARLRNKTGYYDKYNTGAKSYGARLHLI